MKSSFRCLAVLIVLFGTSLAGSLHAEDPAPMALLGKWVVESALEEGQAVDRPVGDTVEFAKDKMIVTPKDGRKEPNAMYVVNTKETPWQIDISLEQGDQKITIYGVVAVEKKQLKICFSKPGNPRPTKLESQPDSNQLSLILKPAK